MLILVNNFDALNKLITTFLNDALIFIQGLVIILFTIAFIYYKLRQGIGDSQNSHIYAIRSKQVLICLVTIFLAKPIIELLASYFYK